MDNEKNNELKNNLTDREVLEKILSETDNNKFSDELTPPKPAEDEKDVTEPDKTAVSVKKRRKKKRRKKDAVFSVILAIVILSVALGISAYIISVGSEVLAVNKPDETLIVRIPQGSSTEDIAQILVDNEVISKPLYFRFISKMQGAGSGYIAGAHEINKNMSYTLIIENLQKEAIEERDTVNVTIPEGKNIFEAAQILEQNNICNSNEFIEIFNNADFGYFFEDEVADNSLKFYKMEGYLYPDTYTFFAESDTEEVAKKIYKNLSEKLNPKLIQRMKDLDMTLEETITLASMVQAEASGTIDMKNVASVFHNRLNNSDKFPKLQSDPTKKYVRETIIPNSAPVNEKQCLAYDTYECIGLPAGPICNPGLDAIKAVLYPNDTDYYYFCANIETKEIYYAKTLSEHENNLKKAGIN